MGAPPSCSGASTSSRKLRANTPRSSTTTRHVATKGVTATAQIAANKVAGGLVKEEALDGFDTGLAVNTVRMFMNTCSRSLFTVPVQI